ncbi:hypothetical protein FB45DRAFT_1063008 [Roridomyces roridus]|uniref:F-box domain-containing protein n=1 Tax=Roridomyces roridus TaxID=1738132 RepID=A0AAD7FH13_9AGAR|nr:hypothetical protein FB45DRAFT_1063008 [Roridomyces roridus]
MRTRSTPRAHMPITQRLPNEVLTEIIQKAPKSDQARLCRVSKLFHGLALPSLLRTVLLDTEEILPDVLDAFCNAMIQNPARVDSVRSLSYKTYFDYSPADECLIQALTLMTRLEHLSIYDYGDCGVVSSLASFTFPNLLVCSFEVTPDDCWPHIAQFLARHPTITHLRLCDRVIVNGAVPVPEGTLLPTLQYYHGELPLLCAFSKHSLRAVQTPFGAALIEKLSAQTGPNLTILGIKFLFVSQISDALEHLSAHMPHLKSLKLYCWGNWSVRIGTLDYLATYLPRLENLEYLVFNHAAEYNRSVVDLYNDQKTLQVWANTSPTLKGCSIGKIAARKVGDRWEKCRSKVIHSEAGFAVFKEILSVADDE